MIEEALAYAASVGSNVSQMPWYAYTILAISPFFVGCVLAIATTIYWKRINYKSGCEPYSVKLQYRFSFLSGFLSGCFCQYSLQEVGEHLLSIPPLTLKATIVTGIFCALLNQMVYDILRGHAQRKGWTGIYSFMTVHHVKKKEVIDVTTQSDDKDDDDTDTTVWIKPESLKNKDDI
jgi:hypothetical protein|tara:strand:+ start:91 stop:621 length:531 start_codon:yes stop_codon:yes gene_type:complete